jgi:hypothetical protein
MDTIPIEIVEMKLVSTSPITVTFNGGQNPEQWDVEVELSNPQTPGTMTLTRTGPNSGTFDSSLPVIPVFTFTKVGNPSDMRVLDFLLEGISPSILTSTDVPWTVEITDNFVHAEWLDPSSGIIPPTFFDSFSSSGLQLFDVSSVSLPAAGQQGIGGCGVTACQFIVANFVDNLDTKIIQIDVTWGPPGVPVPSVPEVLCDGQQPAQFVDGDEIDGFASWTFECHPNPDWEGIIIEKDPATIIQQVQIWTTSFDDRVVGGISIPIDNSALLLAGVQSVSMWMIPVVIAGIGIGVFVIKRRN